jgi:hypothetical protein
MRLNVKDTLKNPVHDGKLVVGALQPGYLPWLGFFDQINSVDLFLIFDDLQYTRYDWRNRNKIKGPNGPIWLIVPIIRNFGQSISEARVDNSRNWAERHWKTICQCYAKAPHFNKHRSFFQDIYHSKWDSLCELDMTIIYYLMSQLKIHTQVIRSSEFRLESSFKSAACSENRKNERIVFFMKELGGNVLLNGEKSRTYMNEEYLHQHQIDIRIQQYRHPVYPQLHGPFVPYLSVIDLLFNCGEESLEVLSKGS